MLSPPTSGATSRTAKRSADNRRPAFDPQMQIYDDLLALLDKAITDLGGGGTGPGRVDLVYGGDKRTSGPKRRTRSRRASTCTRSRSSAPRSTRSALAEAKKGISTAGQRLARRCTRRRRRSATCGRNSSSRRSARISWLARRSRTHDGPERSAPAGVLRARTHTAATAATTYRRGRTPGGLDLARSADSGRTDDPTFSQPIITYDENQLIIAEARRSRPATSAAATTAFNTVRDALPTRRRSRAPTLTDIMNEKYILTVPERRGVERLQAHLHSGAQAGAETSSRCRDGSCTARRRRRRIRTSRRCRTNRRSPRAVTGMTRLVVRSGTGGPVDRWTGGPVDWWTE